jgi:hypothetical protein
MHPVRIRMHPLQYHGKYRGGVAAMTRPRAGGLSRPGSKARRTQDAVLELLREHARQEFGLPTSTRLIFYELESAGLAAKPLPDDERRHRRRSVGWPPGEQDVIDAVTVLREAGEIPWDWITDGERPLIEYPHAPTVRDYMLDRLEEAAVNPWHPASPPLVLTESKNLAQALAAPLAPLVPVVGGLKGQAGEGWLRSVARRVLAEDTGRRVFYLGGCVVLSHLSPIPKSRDGPMQARIPVALGLVLEPPHEVPVLPGRLRAPVRSHSLP